MNKYFLLMPFLAFMCACDKDTGMGPASTLIVIRGYIYANEPVNDIQITKTLALGSEATTPPLVNDAQVVLVKGDSQYLLEPSPGDSGYYHYLKDDLNVETGDVFTILVSYNGQIVSGTTIVPQPPANVALSDSIINVSFGFNPGAPPSDNMIHGSIKVTWDADQSALLCSNRQY
jgi:hypothetical protein